MRRLLDYDRLILPVQHENITTRTSANGSSSPRAIGDLIKARNLCNALQRFCSPLRVVRKYFVVRNDTNSCWIVHTPCRQPPLRALGAPNTVPKILAQNHNYRVLSVNTLVSNSLTNPAIVRYQVLRYSRLLKAMFDETSVLNPNFDPASLRPYNRPL